MNILLNNKTNFTSPEYKVDRASFLELHVGVTGTGTVKIESQSRDGVFRSWPESVLKGPSAQIVAVPPGKFRVVVVGTATVEIRS